jgi:hypothetical protein
LCISSSRKTVINHALTGHRNFIEKTLKEERKVLGIVSFGGAEVSKGSTSKDFDLIFSLGIYPAITVKVRVP